MSVFSADFLTFALCTSRAALKPNDWAYKPRSRALKQNGAASKPRNVAYKPNGVALK
jgi:hypothetical protein